MRSLTGRISIVTLVAVLTFIVAFAAFYFQVPAHHAGPDDKLSQAFSLALAISYSLVASLVATLIATLIFVFQHIRTRPDESVKEI